MKALGLSANAPGVPGGISREGRDVSADTPIRLGGHFGVDPRFWPNLQAAHDPSRGA